MMLGVFYLIVDVWRWQKWCVPFLWIGTNALTVYLAVNDGVWDRLFTAMADDPDFEYIMIDSTIVRAHQHAAGKKGGLKLARSAARGAA